MSPWFPACLEILAWSYRLKCLEGWEQLPEILAHKRSLCGSLLLISNFCLLSGPWLTRLQLPCFSAYPSLRGPKPTWCCAYPVPRNAQTQNSLPVTSYKLMRPFHVTRRVSLDMMWRLQAGWRWALTVLLRLPLNRGHFFLCDSFSIFQLKVLSICSQRFSSFLANTALLTSTPWPAVSWERQT